MNQAVNYSNSTFCKGFNNSISERITATSSAPFEVHTFEWLEQNRPLGNEKPDRLTGFEILWVKKGDGMIKIDAERHKINNNSIYCLTPGQLRQIEGNNNFQGFYITFSRDFLYIMQSHSGFSFGFEQYSPQSNLPVISVDEEMQAELEEVALKMVREFANYFLLRSEILKVLLNIFLIYITRKIDVKQDESTQEREVEIVRKFLSSLKEHFVTKKMVSEYAKELCLTPNYFNQIVKRVTGFTASYHIQQQIILEAKRQAIYSGLSMKEVAYALGFDDYIHFSKFFKANSGLNFTSFKKSKREILS